MATQNQREAHTKQQREDGIELPVDQQILQVTHHLVDNRSCHRLLLVSRQKRPERELWEVCQRNA